MGGVSGIPRWEEQKQRPSSKSAQNFFEEQHPLSWIMNHISNELRETGVILVTGLAL